MKSVLMLFTCLFGLNAFADLKEDIEMLKNMTNIGSNGGDASVYNYDVRKFSYNKEEKELREDIGGSSCKFTQVTGRRELISSISSFSIFSGSHRQAKSILQRLYDQNQLVGAVGFYWSGDDGESESCSLEGLKIFFKNGEMLMIAHDSTT